MARELLRLPASIDLHVHPRDFEEKQKETIESATAAAIHGGITTIIAMPNTRPAITSSQTFDDAELLFREQACCDWGLYYGATAENIGQYDPVLDRAISLKMYLNSTHGSLLLTDPEVIRRHFQSYPANRPVLVHAEEDTLHDVLRLVEETRRPVYFCHVSTAREIRWLRKAKNDNLPVFIEVTPHHLFLTEDDERVLGPFGRMKPPLRTRTDIDALWKNLDIIDTIGSDHAPHTREEKESDNPPYGVPGLETTLPLLLTAMVQGRISLEKLVRLTSTNPARIFKIPLNPGSYAEIDIRQKRTIENKNLLTKCGWSPFAGMETQGVVRRVFMRGKLVYDDGEILAAPGFGRQIKPR